MSMHERTTTELIQMEHQYVEDAKDALSRGHYNTAYQFSKVLIDIKKEMQSRIQRGKW